MAIGVKGTRMEPRTTLTFPDGTTISLVDWRCEILRMPVGPMKYARKDEEWLIFSVLLFPMHGREFITERLGNLELWIHGKCQYVAPVESLMNRWRATMRLDEVFEQKALWFVAEDIMSQLKEETKKQLVPLTEKTQKLLQAAKSYMNGVSLEIGGALASDLAGRLFIPGRVKERMQWRLRHHPVASDGELVAEQHWEANYEDAMKLDAELVVFHRMSLAE